MWKYFKKIKQKAKNKKKALYWKLHRLQTRNQTHIVIGGYFLKIYRNRENAAISREMSAAKHVLATKPWSRVDTVVNKPVIRHGPIGISRAPRVDGAIPNLRQCEHVSIRIAREASTDVKKCPWVETIDRRVAHGVLPALSSNAVEVVEATLANMWLPQTGAHGDFVPENILMCEDGNFTIIDWELFRSRGSHVVDACHLACKAALRKNDLKCNLPQERIECLRSYRFLKVFQPMCNVNCEQAIALHVFEEASSELNLQRLTEEVVAERMNQRLQALARSVASRT